MHLGGLVAGVLAIALVYPRPATASDAAQPVQLRPQTFDTGLYSISRTIFSHNGRLVAFLGYAAPNRGPALEVTVFEVSSRRLVKTLPVPDRSWVILKGGLAFSPDDSRLAAGADEITIWDTKTWTEAGHAPGPFADGVFGADDLLGLAYAPDGRQIIAAYGEVWGPGRVQVGSREKFVSLREAARQAYRVGKTPDAYQRPEIEVLDASTGVRHKRLAIARGGRRGDRSQITSGLVVSQDGGSAYVAVQDFEGLGAPPQSHTTPRVTVERVDLESGQVSPVVERRQEDDFTAIAVNAGQSLFATGEAVGNKHSWRKADGTWVNRETADPVRLWSPRGGELQAELGQSIGAVRQLWFLPDGSGVVACQTDARFHNLMAIWSVATKSLTAVVRVVTPQPTRPSCSLSQDGRQAVLTVPTGEALRSVSSDTAYLVNVASAAR